MENKKMFETTNQINISLIWNQGIPGLGGSKTFTEPYISPSGTRGVDLHFHLGLDGPWGFPWVFRQGVRVLHGSKMGRSQCDIFGGGSASSAACWHHTSLMQFYEMAQASSKISKNTTNYVYDKESWWDIRTLYISDMACWVIRLVVSVVSIIPIMYPHV